MELNNKMIRIISILGASGGQTSVQEMSASLAVSRRALYYNVEKLNIWLQDNSFHPLVLQEGRIRVSYEELERIQAKMAAYDSSYYVLTAKERHALIYLQTALSVEAPGIEALGTMLNVSRNTILTDISTLREYLQTLDIQLSSQGKSGYRLVGEEAAIRYQAMDYIYGMAVEKSYRMAINLLFAAAQTFRGAEVNETTLNEICAIIRTAEDGMRGKLNQHSFADTAIYVLLIYIRSSHGCQIVTREQEEVCPEYRAAEEISRGLYDLGFKLAESEVVYLTNVLLGAKVYDFREVADKQNATLNHLAWDLIHTFETVACVNIHDKEEFFNRLLLHITPMYYRLKYKIKMKNFFTEEIKQKYGDIYQLTQLTVRAIQEDYGLQIPDEEIAYICIYMGGWLRKHEMERNSGWAAILIICNYGVGTSLLVKEQIRKILGEDYQYLIMDERQMSAKKLDGYDLIVSTVKLPDVRDTVIMVSPIITEGQKQQLVQWSLGNNHNAGYTDVGQIINVVKKHTKVSNESALIADLLKVISGGEMEEDCQILRLTDVLTPASIKIVAEKQQYEQAIHLACETLISQGVVSAGYGTSILEVIDGMGLYSELAPGIMLAHGKPSEKVNRVGLSLTLYRQPISFAKWDKEITVIFTLAAIDNESHFYVLKDLLTLIRQEECCRRLTGCMFAHETEVHRYLRKIGEETNDKGLSK